MSRKRRSREDEIVLEVQRLDDALDELVAQLGTALPMADAQPQIAAAQAKIRRDAAVSIAAVSERKAKLLGLDAPIPKQSESGEGDKPGSLAELEKKLALVGRDRSS